MENNKLRFSRNKLKEINDVNRNIANSRLENSASTSKTTFFKFCWWNGGGKIKLRLNTNPELRKFLSRKPDIFGYGETGTPSSVGLSINGYANFFHASKLNIEGNYRRGLAIFFLSKYRFLLNKVYCSKIYDIVWLRLTSPVCPLFSVFFIPLALTIPYK